MQVIKSKQSEIQRRDARKQICYVKKNLFFSPISQLERLIMKFQT